MAKRYPPEVVELANGGMFRRVVGKKFNYKNVPDSMKGVDEDKFFDKLDAAEAEAAKKKTSDKRKKYVGSTPSKYSDVGKHVLERMYEEDPSQIKNMPKGGPEDWSKEDLKNVDVRGEDGKFYDYDECDMGHYPIDAVVYWNNVGRFYGPKAPEVREWMNDPNIYILQPGVLNQGDGRIMGASGITYQPPVKLPDGVDMHEIEPQVLKELRDFKGEPVETGG